MKLKKKLYLLFKSTITVISIIGVFHSSVCAQQRINQSINTGWEFHKGDILTGEKVIWEQVSLPHTWNISDVNDDVLGYYRGISWYRKKIFIPSNWKNKCVYINFEGVNQTAEVYVNGQLAGKHIGGYSGFRLQINQFLKFSDDNSPVNEINVKVDNSANNDIPPLSADFTFYGGIYRDVSLIVADRVHFQTNNYSSPGIRISTSDEKESEAKVIVKCNLQNTAKKQYDLKIQAIVTGAAGNIVFQHEKIIPVSDTVTPISLAGSIKNPHLWSPDDPYLYHVITKIIDNNTGETLDEETSPLGIRWFRFSADSGFFLNGKLVKLIGANRHQDFKNMGNALPNALHERDIQLLKDMGANFIRIAHYPQDPTILEACDRLGILASVEIPIVNEITESAAFTQNCLLMLREMIEQNYNHPSVIIWAYMNEILLHPHYKTDSQEQKQYFKNIIILAKSIDSLSHKLDPFRYTMIPCNGNFGLYNSVGLTKVPQIVGWNIYSGWYSGGLEGFEKFLDRHHQELPGTPMIVTEYGADADTRSHSLNPERFDKTIEYQILYHAHDFKEIMKRQFVAGAAIWNLIDFNSEQRGESTPHMNTKGLITANRQPKDSYLFYQANLLKVRFLKFGGQNWLLRSGIAGSDGVCVQDVNVFTNQSKINLYLNGTLLQSAVPNQGYVTFKVPFKNGQNVLKVTSGLFEDLSIVQFKMIPAILSDTKMPFTSLNVSLGDRRFFIDDKLQEVWLPDQPYSRGSWGYIGGAEFKMENTGRMAFGSDKAIFNTPNGAIYETQRIGIREFKADVPDGEYEIVLHFAELQGKTLSKALLYNLENAQPEDSRQHAFDVLVNKIPVISALSNMNYLLPQTAYSTTTRISVKNGEGITVLFNTIKGEPFLNAIQICKKY